MLINCSSTSSSGLNALLQKAIIELFIVVMNPSRNISTTMTVNANV
ncbi:hypothetical protein [Alistipes ihumii]|nr:hypothetical protein [Alistipes ihumii]